MNKLRRVLKSIGPGFITGASDDDPSGIATYSQTGAIFGYAQAWTAIFSFPFMSVVQEMCGRIGLVTGKGLSGVIKHYYSRKVLLPAVALLLIANTVNIGADLGAMASAMQLVVGVPFTIILIGMTIFILILEILVPYRVYSRLLKFLALSLLAYVVAAFIVRQDWSSILLSSLMPSLSLNRDYLLNIVAILGTTISPYLFFWQTGEEVEEEVEKGRLRTMGKGVPKVYKKDITAMRKDTLVGMFFSNLVMFFIIVTCASTLHLSGITSIETADQAASALRPLAGDFAYILFAMGVVGTGLLAVPVLAGSAAYALSEAFNWNEGLYLKFKKALGFYGVILVATVIGLLVNFTPIEPFKMLYYAAILNGIVAPPLIILILLIANNGNIMGKRTNPLISNVLGGVIALIMTVASLALILSFLGII